MKTTIRREPPKTCAIYARCACKSEESIRKQIEACKAEALNQGWTVADEHILCDDGQSGPSDHRPGLDSLLELAEDKSHPIDVLLVDDSSRIGRNISNVLSIRIRLAKASVAICFPGVAMSKYDKLLLALYGRPVRCAKCSGRN